MRPMPKPTPQPTPIPKAGPSLPRFLELTDGNFHSKPFSSLLLSRPFIPSLSLYILEMKEQNNSLLPSVWAFGKFILCFLLEFFLRKI